MKSSMMALSLVTLLGAGVACQVQGMNEPESTKKDINGRWSDPFSDGEDSGDEVFLREKVIEQEAMQKRKELQQHLKDLKENADSIDDMWTIEKVELQLQDLQARFPDK